MPPVDQMRPGERRRSTRSSPSPSQTLCPEWPRRPIDLTSPVLCREEDQGHRRDQNYALSQTGSQLLEKCIIHPDNQPQPPRPPPLILQRGPTVAPSSSASSSSPPPPPSPPPKCRSRTSGSERRRASPLLLPAAGAGARVRRMMMKMSSKICRLRATSALVQCASASFSKLLLVLLLLSSITGPAKGLKITPKPCTNALGEEGTCMFVWECIKTDGKHLGTCVDGILFGSCCGHNETANEITSSWVSMSPSPSSGDSSTSSQWTEYQPFHPSSPSVAQFSSPPTPSSASSASSSSFTSIHVVTGSSPSFPGSVSSWPGSAHHSSHHNPPTSSSVFPSASSPISSSSPTSISSSSSSSSSSSLPSSSSSSSPSSPFTSSSPFDPFGSSYDPHLSFTSSSTTTTSTTESPFSYSTSLSAASTSSSGSFGSPPYQYPPPSQPVDTFGPTNSQYPQSVNYPPNSNGGQSPGEQQQHHQQQVHHQTPASQQQHQQHQHQHQHQQQLYPTSGSQQQQPQKPWQPVSSLNQSPPNGPINVIGPVKWPSNNGQTQVSTTSTTASPPVTGIATVMHSFRPPIFSIFGTHRPPVGSVFLKPPRPTRPPFHRPPFNPNRPTAISLFSPFSTRPTVTPIYAGASSSHNYPVVTSPSRPQGPATMSTTSTSTTTSSTTTPAPDYINSWPTPHRPGGYPGVSVVTSDSNNNIINNNNNNGITDIPFTTHASNDATASSSSSSPSSSSFSTSPSLPLLVTKKPVPIAKVECGTPPLLPQTKVVGGKNAAFGSWPWQVSVRRTSFFGFSSNHRCGGAIINNQWIATAGHCVDDLLLSQIRIRVGEYDFSSAMEPLPFVERGAKKKVVHPHYNFFTYENDLALVQLDEPIEFQPHISPICLPPESVDLVGRNATVTGWGRLSEGGILPSVLQEVRVPIVSNDKCKGMFLSAGRHEYIPEIFMCAGYPEGGRDSCQGDSGGPLQVQGDDGKWFLAGIISWGIGCAEPNLPGVCTRISKFKNWIVSTVS